VLDPAGTAPIDGYEVSPRLRAAVRYWQVADVFPFGTCTSPSMDLDHTEPYLPTDYGGPPGQTRFDNLGPMARSSHRAVTHGGWQKHQPEPGYFLHRSPQGYVYLVTNQGTLALGRNDFSRAVWSAARPHREAVAA
ncbi:MAG TPA: HNH endonuclease, partial [Propionibacteriaceae bacterium]|nr:HNH endonuclease [Propionibacteriaceae bacterium]